MQQNSKKAFTLVELIVVITILAILGSIAFISLQSYTKNARDGQRLSDINNIRKNLELFLTEKGFYPTPDNGVNITYSGSTAWIQGTVGDNVIKNLQKLNKKPTDPLTQNEYTYSITNLKTEYQIGAILEGGSILGYNKLINQANAATPLKKATAMVVGTYNEKILKTSTGGLDYILAVPSIINGDIQDVDLMSIITKKQLVYNNYTNLPDSYKNLGYSMTGGFDFIPNKLVVYSGSTQDLLQDSNKLILINNIKQAYINTIVQGEPTYKEIINTDTTSNQAGAITLVNNYLLNGMGGLPKISPNNLTQSTSPQLTFLQNCTATGQIIYEDSNGLELGRVNNTGTTISGNPGLITCVGHIVVCSGNGVGYVLQACNLGSSVVGTGSSSYGNYYQWGNNGGTSYGNKTPNTTVVNASSYGPGNYYNSTTFIGGASLPNPQDWTNPQNNNLWGDTINTFIARQGPCSIGYHLPTGGPGGEWQLIYNSGLWGSSAHTAFSNSLKLPFSGYRRRSDGTMQAQNIAAYYWSSSPDGVYSYVLAVYTASGIYPNLYNIRADGFNLRCIKN
nr:prepilin-type N-terminal cleavage/methylation domain-containing protein [Candidatus Gracilibacteria bacterium]